MKSAMPSTVIEFEGVEYEGTVTSLTRQPNGDGGPGYYSRSWTDNVIDSIAVTNVDLDELVQAPPDEVYERLIDALEEEFNVVRA